MTQKIDDKVLQEGTCDESLFTSDKGNSRSWAWNLLAGRTRARWHIPAACAGRAEQSQALRSAPGQSEEHLQAQRDLLTPCCSTLRGRAKKHWAVQLNCSCELGLLLPGQVSCSSAVPAARLGKVMSRDPEGTVRKVERWNASPWKS